MASREFEDFYQTLMRRQVLSQDFEMLMADFPAAADIEWKEFFIGKIPASWAHAPHATKAKVVLFFHGGGYATGSIQSHRDLIGRLSRALGMDVMAINYRLAPEYPFPAALEEGRLAYDYLLKSYEPSQIVLAGISAGGGLAISLMLSLKGTKLPMPRAGIALCPWVDLALTGETLESNNGQDIIRKSRLKQSAKMYLGEHNPKDPLASPLYGDLHGLPPLIIQAGSKEVLLGEIQRFAQKAIESHVQVHFEVFADMFHAWHLFAAKIPEGVEAIEKAANLGRNV